MKVKINDYEQAIIILRKLKVSYPKYNIGKHLATALDGHNLWGISDKDVVLALKKYKSELALDMLHEENDIEDIIKGGMQLNNILEEEED